MINVAFTISSLSMGGIERVTTTIANALAMQSGFDVTLINLANKKEYFDVHTQHYVKPDKLQYDWWRTKRKLRHTGLFSIDLTWKYWVERLFIDFTYDYIILNPDFFPYFDIIKRLHPESKIYLWMHNNYDIYTGKYYKDILSQLKHAVQNADGIICLERYSARKWKLMNPHVVVIYNPLTLDSGGNISKLENRIIACTSRLTKEQKGLDYVLDVADKLPSGWRIDYAGDGADRAWMDSEVRKRHAEQKIHLLGALNDKQLDQHYVQASMYLCLSRWEGFPLVLAEAMSRGLPIIGFNIPALREVLSDGKYGVLVPLGDSSAVVEAIVKLSSDYELRKYYSELSLKRCEHFSLPTILNEWKTRIFHSLKDANHR